MTLTVGVGPEVLAQEPVPPSLRQAQMLHGLAGDRTRLSSNQLPEP
jgi:hypothetical protein